MAVLMVLLSGGQIYQNVVNDISVQYESRTSISYITTKLRRCDSLNSVSIDFFGDSDALVLSEIREDGKIYETIIYLHEGNVKELFVERGTRLTPSAGMTILAVEDIEFSMQGDNLVAIEYSTSEGSYTAYVHLRAGGGEL